MLAADKSLHAFARARAWDDDGRHAVHSLEGETVAIVGAGGIGRALIALLEPFGAEVIAVTRRGRDVPGRRPHAAGRRASTRSGARRATS